MNITSIKYPDMFRSASTKTITGSEATLQNLKTLLLTEKGSLFGDPYYGTNLKKLLFEQNNQVLRDIVIDDVYSAIATFLPQLKVARKDIELNSVGSTLYITLKAKNLLDFNLETINLALFNAEDL